MSISNLRVAFRLALAFGVVCLVMSLSAAVGIWRLSGLQHIADELGGPASERAVLARELHAIVVLSSARAETLLEIDNCRGAQATGCAGRRRCIAGAVRCY